MGLKKAAKTLKDCGEPYWLMIIGADNHHVYVVFPQVQGEVKEAQYISEPLELPFKLSGTVGEERFWAVASHRKFFYDRDVKHAVDRTRTLLQRGIDTRYELSLPSGFSQRSVHFSTY
jgi:hypothetical protein